MPSLQFLSNLAALKVAELTTMDWGQIGLIGLLAWCTDILWQNAKPAWRRFWRG